MLLTNDLNRLVNDCGRTSWRTYHNFEIISLWRGNDIVPFDLDVSARIGCAIGLHHLDIWTRRRNLVGSWTANKAGCNHIELIKDENPIFGSGTCSCDYII